MPADALPQPRSVGGVTYQRSYRDPLGRPMTGTVTLTGQTRTEQSGTVVLPAPVTVELSDGILAVTLAPDTYTVTANLRNAEGQRLSDSDTVTLKPPVGQEP